jgi:hypothetical protein
MAGRHPKFVQEMFGHANISITLDTYSHVIEGMDGGLAEAMDVALQCLLLPHCCHRGLWLPPDEEKSA